MNPGEIWWGQIGNSLRLLGRIAGDLNTGVSVVLQDAGSLPWKEQFHIAVDSRRTSFSSDRRLRRLLWRAGADPGQFVLKQLCTKKAQVEYWPGQTYAEHIAACTNEVVHAYYVWVTGIHAPEDLERWKQFIADYERESAALETRTVYVLEYDGPAPEADGLDLIRCTVHPYDCRVFCLEAATATQNTALLEFQAELALRIGGARPEFCAALISSGEALLRLPLETVRTVCRSLRDSQGQPFPSLTDEQVSGAVWQASIVQLFPAIEQRRTAFIRNHTAELSCHLPIRNSNGDSIEDPWELDIGPLFYIVNESVGEFSPAEVEEIRLFRSVRNLLAHNRPVPYKDICAVLGAVQKG